MIGFRQQEAIVLDREFYFRMKINLHSDAVEDEVYDWFVENFGQPSLDSNWFMFYGRVCARDESTAIMAKLVFPHLVIEDVRRISR
jgi:hypothetical protein